MEKELFNFICFKFFLLGMTVEADETFFDFFKDTYSNMQKYLNEIEVEWNKKTPEEKAVWKTFRD